MPTPALFTLLGSVGTGAARADRPLLPRNRRADQHGINCAGRDSRRQLLDCDRGRPALAGTQFRWA